MLVGCEQDRAPLVAGRDEPEEQVGLHAVQGPKVDFVDDEQAAVEVPPRAQARRRGRRLHLQHVHQIVEHDVGDTESVLDGIDPERRRQVRLSNTRRPERQHVGLLVQVLTGRQEIDLPVVRPRLQAPFKALKRLAGQQPRALEHGRHAALVLPLELARQQVSSDIPISPDDDKGTMLSLPSAAPRPSSYCPEKSSLIVFLKESPTKMYPRCFSSTGSLAEGVRPPLPTRLYTTLSIP